MLAQSLQGVVQTVATDGLGVGGMVGLFGTMAVVVVLILDRLVFMLQARGIIPKKAGNPNGLEKIKELHEWYTPKNVGEKPPCMSWLPVDEFMSQQKESIELLKKILEIQEENR